MTTLSSLSGGGGFPPWPPYTPGRRYPPPYTTETSSNNLGGRATYVPFPIRPGRHTLDSIYVQAKTTAGFAKIALYTDNNGTPGDLVQASPEIAISDNSEPVPWNLGPVDLNGGGKGAFYWIAVAGSGAGVLSTFAFISDEAAAFYGVPINSLTAAMIIEETVTYGAFAFLDNPDLSLASATNNAPRVSLGFS